MEYFSSKCQTRLRSRQLHNIRQAAGRIQRSNFWQTYMPSKPRKYKLKIFWVCESSTGYDVNAIAYGGKEGDQVRKNLSQDIALKLLKPYYELLLPCNTLSYDLAKLLLEKNFFNYLEL